MNVRPLLLWALLSPTLLLSRAQNVPAKPADTDPLQRLDFLVGNWSARTNGTGSAGATVVGVYRFGRDLGGHALQRTSSADACTGPATFDCRHHDQLTIFPEPDGGIAALYLDSEGHVIHYTVTTPDPHTALFLSQSPVAAPHFRLTYHLEGTGPTAVMTGSFEGSAPGSSDFHPYLQWSGTRQ